MADCENVKINSDTKYFTKSLLLNGFELEIDNIIDTKIGKDQTRHYLVCLKSWLSESQLNGYKGLIEQYWKQKKENEKNWADNGSDQDSLSDKENQYNSQSGIKSKKTSIFLPTQTIECNEQQKEIVLQDGVSETNNLNIEGENGNNKENDHSTTINATNPSTIETSNNLNEMKTVSNGGSLLNVSDKPLKKRKLKSLDDIVRKISGTNETPAEKKLNISNNLLTERLQTLDETLFEEKQEHNEDDSKENKPFNDSNCFADKKVDVNESLKKPLNGRYNTYWSAGKVFHKPTRSFKCHVCDHRFDNEDVLHEHEQTHELYGCQNFNQMFKSPAALEEHREVHKSRQKYHKCQFCSTLHADLAMLQRHENSHFITPERHPGLPPPLLMQVHNESREFPQHQNEQKEQSNVIDPTAVLRSTPDNFVPDADHKTERTSMENEEGNEDKSIVRNPLRNLLGRMYHNHRKTGSEFSGHVPEDLSYKDYPHNYTASPDRSPEYQKIEIAEPHTTTDSHTKKDDNQPFKELVYTCPICKKTFGKKETFDLHWDTLHPDETQFSCEMCNEIFFSKDLFEAHLPTHLKQEFVCGFCQKAFDRRSAYEAHLRSHTHERPYHCYICGRSFSLRTSLRRHMLIHTDITPYHCHICLKGFRRSDMLSIHMRQYHDLIKVEVENKLSNAEKHTNTEDKYIEERHQMSSGQPQLSVFNNYKQSEQYARELNQSSNQFGPRKYFSPRYIDESRVYYDSQILPPANGSKVRYHHSPVNPVNHHSPVNPANHHSPSSAKLISNGPTMIQQTNGMRSSDGPTMIHISNGMSSSEVTTMIHRSNGMFSSAGFDPKSLNTMSMVPISQPPLSQPPSFVKLAPVNILAQPQTRANMECKECNETFTSISLFDIHMQSHVKESYKCEKCQKTFSRKNHYDSHMQSHETNKSHNCPYCHRSFSMKGNLRRHIRIHTNEAPYECPICFQRFRRSDGLKGHIKRHETMGESAPNDLVPSQASG